MATITIVWVMVMMGLGMPGTQAQKCVLQVPANPLTAQGLATPYQMTGCDMAGETPSFVEAVIFDPATNQVSVYPPLVINAGTKPAVTPTPPNLPPGAVVGLWFGTNGESLTLTGAGVASGNCVNGLGKSIFGQFAYCNAPAFFQAAKGKVTTPALGTGADGMPCLTTRDFGLVDMDPSDNVVTTYLLTKAKQVCQNTAANRAKNPGATVLVNGSDNRLLQSVLTALNCARFTAPDLSDPGARVSALALNELQASAQQQAPLALIQDNDPMTLIDGKSSLQKRNLYRQGVNQPLDVPETSISFCTNYRAIAPVRYLAGQAFTTKAASPDPGAGTNLFTFLCSRFEASYGADGLNCAGLLKQASPLTVTKNQAGAVAACALAQSKMPSPTAKKANPPPTTKGAATKAAATKGAATKAAATKGKRKRPRRPKGHVTPNKKATATPSTASPHLGDPMQAATAKCTCPAPGSTN